MDKESIFMACGVNDKGGLILKGLKYVLRLRLAWEDKLNMVYRDPMQKQDNINIGLEAILPVKVPITIYTM